MNVKKSPVVGIDVSKDTFNAHWNGKDAKYSNSPKGWKKLVGDSHAEIYSMEATGSYHYKLACFLKNRGFTVYVNNPLWVKRFIQSLGTASKTDKKDARLIAKYALSDDAPKKEFEPLSEKLHRAKMIISIFYQLDKMERIAGNLNHAVELKVRKGDTLSIPMENVIYTCKEERESLQKELYETVEKFYPEEFKHLQTIPGIGKKAAAVMLIELNGFRFDNSRQVASWAGIAPSTYESGVSVMGSGRIRKVGSSYLRKVIYGCVASAIRFNKPCMELYDRLRLRGKTHKCAAVAVMHRLIKISFGVVKSGEAFRGGKTAMKPV